MRSLDPPSDGSSEGTSLVVSPQLVAQAKVLKQAAVSGLQKARRDKMKAVREAAEQALAIFSMEIRGSGESIESLTPRENRRASSSASSTVSAGVPDTSSAHRGGSNTGRQQGWTDGSRRSPDIQLASPEQVLHPLCPPWLMAIILLHGPVCSEFPFLSSLPLHDSFIALCRLVGL